MNNRHALLLGLLSAFVMGNAALGQSVIPAPTTPALPQDVLQKEPPRVEPAQVEPAPAQQPKEGAAPPSVYVPPAPSYYPTDGTKIDNSTYFPNNGYTTYANGCSDCENNCDYQWFIHWTCDDLKMEPAERGPCCTGIHGWLFCPEEEPECDCEGNGNGNGNGNGEEDQDVYVFNEKGELVLKDSNGNGNGEEKNGENGEDIKEYVFNEKGELVEKTDDGNGNGNGNGEEEEEEEEEGDDLNPLMGFYKCHCPGFYNCLDYHKINMYGFLQMGFTGNFDSPRDRLNFGVNNNNRSNDFLVNQLYYTFEREVQNYECFDWGFRVDVLLGADAFENAVLELGFLDEAWSPGTFSYGVDVPQFYVDFHLPILTKKGIDIRVGHIYTLMGYEVWPGTDTPFYSRSYESFYGIPFTHTGVDTITYIGDTVALHNGMFVGWDNVFEDNNRAWSYMGSLNWASCDGRKSMILSWIIGPEQTNNNQDYRSNVTLNYTQTFGRCDQWTAGVAGILGFDPNAVDGQDAQWYGILGALYYTVNPKCILGVRGEWFADPQGFRTGFATDFYAVTAGVTYKPFQNVRIRPEIRFDWDGYDNVTPYNDQTDSFQTTAAFDIIWDF